MDKDARIAQLEGLLTKHRDQFAYYASNHAMKAGNASDPDVYADATRKAAVNTEFVEEANRVLAGALPPLEGLDILLADVTEFHAVFAPDWLPGPMPMPLSLTEAETRAKWIKSEGTELADDTRAARPMAPGSDEMFDLMAKQVDAFLDAIYFSLGGLVRMGVRPSALWRIVHGQNMAKRNPDGTVTRRAGDGKVVKPAGWVDPHELLVAEIKRQADAA